MDVPPPLAPHGGSRTLVDLDTDSLAHCISFLELQDVSNLAMTCKSLRLSAYSDSVWYRLFRERWPRQGMCSGVPGGAREAYLERRVSLQQFKFLDPLEFCFCDYGEPCSRILMNKNDVYLAKGSSVQNLKIGTSVMSSSNIQTLRGHNARITSMRLFPLSDTPLGRTVTQNYDTMLVTSSADHTIRLWRKGRSQRCFKGHNSPVTTLADQLLGGCSSKMLASGGEDGTVRLWSLSSRGKHQPLAATFYGHEKPISLLSVAGHNPSLLVSISKDAKIRVWDTTASSSRSSSCVGMTCVYGQPVDMRCHEAICYIASGSSVTAVDLRTMHKAFTSAIHTPKLHSFGMLPSKSLICTGMVDKAMLWDIRNHERSEVADLDGHVGPITAIHIDPYKVVTGGPYDPHVKIWETDTGTFADSVDCCSPDDPEDITGLSAMAVDGYRIVTACCGVNPGHVYFRDFSDCSIPVSFNDCKPSSKFWEAQHS